MCVFTENRARGTFRIAGCRRWKMQMAREFKNAAELERTLRELPKKLQQRAVKSALRKGATVIKKAAQKNARRFDDPATASKVWKEITVRAGKRRRNGDVVMHVGVKGGAKRYVNNKENRRKGRVGGSYEGPGDVYYWRFLEFGTKFQRAQPFMRPAMSEHWREAMDTVSKALEVAIAKQAEKM